MELSCLRIAGAEYTGFNRLSYEKREVPGLSRPDLSRRVSDVPQADPLNCSPWNRHTSWLERCDRASESDGSGTAALAMLAAA